MCLVMWGWGDAPLQFSASDQPLTFVLRSLVQVEVKKAEPRYATASASAAEAYRLGAGMGGYNSQANYGGMTCLTPK